MILSEPKIAAPIPAKGKLISKKKSKIGITVKAAKRGINHIEAFSG